MRERRRGGGRQPPPAVRVVPRSAEVRGCAAGRAPQEAARECVSPPAVSRAAQMRRSAVCGVCAVKGSLVGRGR